MAQKRLRTRGGIVGLAAAGMLLAFSVPSLAADTPLAAAQKAIKAGKPAIAVNTLTAALAGSGLKGGDIARAYLVRGQAHAKSGNTAAGIADLTHAMWLKGLSESERAEATAAKAALYRQAGLATSNTEAAPEPAIAAATAEAPAPVKPSKASKPKLTAAPEPVVAAETAPEDLPWKNAPKAQPVAVVSAETQTEVVHEIDKETVASADPAEASVPAGKAKTVARPAATGTIFVQVASLRSAKEADELAARLIAEKSAVLGEASAHVKAMVMGNMGTFYAVHVGPVTTPAAATSLCRKLQGSVVDCFVAKP
jgi:uncharacterized protein YejL (UPF0352 family)